MGIIIHKNRRKIRSTHNTIFLNDKILCEFRLKKNFGKKYEEEIDIKISGNFIIHPSHHVHSQALKGRHITGTGVSPCVNSDVMQGTLVRVKQLKQCRAIQITTETFNQRIIIVFIHLHK